MQGLALSSAAIWNISTSSQLNLTEIRACHVVITKSGIFPSPSLLACGMFPNQLSNRACCQVPTPPITPPLPSEVRHNPVANWRRPRQQANINADSLSKAGRERYILAYVCFWSLSGLFRKCQNVLRVWWETNGGWRLHDDVWFQSSSGPLRLMHLGSACDFDLSILCSGRQ